MPSEALTTTRAETAQPVALYIDLLPGLTADLEVVSEAALHFVYALREAAAILDSDVTIRVELQSGTEGSLSLNSFIRLVSTHSQVDYKTVRALALCAATWFGVHVADWTFDKVADALYEEVKHHFGDHEAEKTHSLSADDHVKLASQLNQIQKSPAVQAQVGQVYKKLNRDTAIKGVGFKFDHSREPPAAIVDREEFKTRILDAKDIETTKKLKTTTSAEIVKLISPILDPAYRRKWYVVSSDGPVYVNMNDYDFIDRLTDGRIKTALNNNIRLDVLLSKVEEQKEDKSWRVKSFSITKVNRIILPASEEKLSALSPGEEEPNHK